MSRSPSIAPALPNDQDIYLVFDDFGEPLGRAWRETGEERTDWKTVITDLMDGQYADPIWIVAFNTWRDGVETCLRRSQTRSPNAAAWTALTLPPFLERFVEWHRSGQPRQLPLPLRGAA